MKPEGGGDDMGRQLPTGTVFGRYVIDEHLGAGGMAAVFRAHHAVLGRVVALKIMHRVLALDENHVQRFMEEARAAASITHPNIVDVSDVGSVEGRPYLVMEYLEGETLASRLARVGFMVPTEIVDLLLPLLSGVSAAHQKGIVHRDIKPDNIFLAADPRGASRPVLLDFGISKNVDVPRGKALTEVGQLVGTPYYMSPEQIQKNVELDGRADQYALGVVMYECATGVLPFRTDASLYLLLAEIILGRTEPLTAHAPAVPRSFERIVARAMANSRDSRFPSIELLARALLPFASPEVREARTVEFGGDPLAAPRMSSLPPPMGPSTPALRSAWPDAEDGTLRPSPAAVVSADLRAMTGLDECSDAELDAFLLAATALRYPRGARLFAQGDEATAAFIVLVGEVEILKSRSSPGTLLDVVGPGGVFGQVGLVDDAPRSASAFSRTDATVLVIGRDVFHRLLASGSPIAMRLQELIAISGIRQLRTATTRLSRLLEERAAAAPQDVDQVEAQQTPRLERLRAALGEWSVDIKHTQTRRKRP